MNNLAAQYDSKNGRAGYEITPLLERLRMVRKAFLGDVDELVRSNPAWDHRQDVRGVGLSGSG